MLASHSTFQGLSVLIWKMVTMTDLWGLSGLMIKALSTVIAWWIINHAAFIIISCIITTIVSYHHRLLAIVILSYTYLGLFLYIYISLYIRNNYQDFPGGPVVKNLPASAGNTGLTPGPGGSHVPQSSWACVLQLLSPPSRARVPQQERPPQGEACAPQQESSTHSLQLEKARGQQQRPSTAKNTYIF